MSSDKPKETSDTTRLSREAVVDAALELLDTVGVDGLSMRVLAERLDVKAASLYWHLRDKAQLLELVAVAVLDSVVVPAGPSWRVRLTAACDGLAATLGKRPASADVVLACLPVVPRSSLTREIASVLNAAGLEDSENAAAALVIAAVGAERLGYGRPIARPSDAMTLAIDSGSYKVQVRAAAPGRVDAATSVGGGGAPSVDLRPDGLVVVSNRRGGYKGAVELSPETAWHIKVHGGTWNTILDLRGLRLRGIEMDSGAGNVTCTLPPPVGVVPIRINSGLLGVTMHRPRGSMVLATIAGGSVRVRLDGKSIRSSASETHWESQGAAHSDDRYELTVHSGCVNISLDDSAPAVPVPMQPPSLREMEVQAQPSRQAVSLILDGIESRLQG